MWDTKDLTRRLCHALDIACQTVERLALNGYTDPDDPNNSLRPEKIISETALLLYATSIVSHLEEVRARTEHLAELLLPYARSERILVGICLEPALAWDYALAHVLLKKLGYKHPVFDAALDQTTRSQAHAGRERTPYRVLEQEWIKGIWRDSGRRTSGPSTRAALSSALGQSIDLLNGTRDDIYAFTHSVMYVTDFNICPGRLPRARRMVRADAEAALAFCLDEQDYDLGGEVLLTWPLTGKSWSPAAAFGFRVLAQVEDKAGFLPSPGTRLERLDKLQGNERTNYLLATAYHTAYVMGLLCAAGLQTGRTPPAKISTRRCTPGSAKLILQFLEADGRSQHWWEVLDQLNDRERDAIAGLLLNITLRRKVKQRDFAGLHQLLATGYGLGLADSPASSQAAEMLERLAILAGANSANITI
jgi:hypothetical protein